MDPVAYIKHIWKVGIPLMVILGGGAVLVNKYFNINGEVAALMIAIIGILALWLYGKSIKVICEKCGSGMEISKGYPTIEFQCKKCGYKYDTKHNSD